MQPKAILDKFSPDDIRQWFEDADTDGNGELCINEFFMWSLKIASSQHGTRALEVAFEKYDKDRTGMLDAIEFGKVCEDLGFGSCANEIFQVLDNDDSGVLSYREIVAALTSQTPRDMNTKGYVHRPTDLRWNRAPICQVALLVSMRTGCC